MFATAAPIVGLRWAPLDALALGLTWRAEFAAPAATVASIDAGGAATELSASIAGLFRPHTLAFGAAWTPRNARLELDLSWAHWSAFRGAAADVAAELQGVAIDPRELELPFRDAFGARLGGEYRFPFAGVAFAVRGGYAYESRILPSDAPGAAQLDGDKHRLAAGFGLATQLDATTRLRLDAHLAAQWVVGASALVPDDDPTRPARRLEGRGVVLSTGATLGVEWR
jgi:long-subunit fatty acid transport protein